GAYLKVVGRSGSRQIEVAYSHKETSGFEWGTVGDTVQFNRADTMEIYDGTYTITEITPVDAPTAFGASRFLITVDKDLPDCVNAQGNCGIENVSETPTVIYRNNVIRNNRARGGLFSTSKPVLIEGNRFDHVSGTALLFCGDCSGWYESGPCREVVVRNNQFIDCMGSLYQFCRGIISIYPEIPNLAAQKKYYYGGTENAFVFEYNTFETFDKPILYVRSADGVAFRNNLIIHNTDYPPISTDPAIILDKANRVRIFGNRFDTPFDPAADVLADGVPEDGIRFTADEPF
ncbi:MAG: right-handed parallel beta-helix repeat-containing protein, partial [Thermoguttaceae bacterium]|nr:right-handed parallel beta-helix repeat-containing protein [Thermoguttaceae bacterium]